MRASDVVDALSLPANARVDLRVPKAMLAANGAPTPGDRRQIQDNIEELRWVAALKPTTVAVPAFSDANRDYAELAVLTLLLRGDAKRARLGELVHRAIPYPVFLVVEHGSELSVSLAHKRRSEGKADAVVLDGKVIDAPLSVAGDDVEDCLRALPLACQPRTSLYSLYQGWIDVLLALHAAQRTGAFAPAVSPAKAAERAEALEECSRLEVAIATLRSAAAKERQVPRQVQLNLELRRLVEALAAARTRL